jgi:hypothetical protein
MFAKKLQMALQLILQIRTQILQFSKMAVILAIKLQIYRLRMVLKISSRGLLQALLGPQIVLSSPTI